MKCDIFCTFLLISVYRNKSFQMYSDSGRESQNSELRKSYGSFSANLSSATVGRGVSRHEGRSGCSVWQSAVGDYMKAQGYRTGFSGIKAQLCHLQAV
jgi:hypothetical protein